MGVVIKEALLSYSFFLAFVLIVFVANIGFTITVVMKSGKKIEGVLIDQTPELVRIRDASGVVFSFKKTMLDLDQMVALENSKSEIANDTVHFPAVLVQIKPSSELPIRSILEVPELVRKNQEVRVKPKVYTNSELEKIIGTYSLSTSNPAENNEPQKEEQTPAAEYNQELYPSVSETEEKWRAEALFLASDSLYSYKALSVLSNECDKAQDYGSAWVVNDPNAGYPTGPTQEQIAAIAEAQVACSRLPEAEARYRTAALQYELFLERARKEGIPPGWVEADRILP